ncbi:MAG: REP-associated tyrosine transposase [Terracidiphilus sp.]
MARPGRNASPEDILRPARTFFVTTKASMGRRLLQTERNAELLVKVLRSLVTEKMFELHDFVIMPDHVHLLMTVDDGMTIEKAMQLIKGRFSYQLSHEFGYKGEIWQRGFSEVQVMNRTSFERHREYIAENPVKAGLVSSPGEYLFCFGSLAAKKRQERAEQGLKPGV